jgi:hypothetical protein
MRAWVDNAEAGFPLFAFFLNFSALSAERSRRQRDRRQRGGRQRQPAPAVMRPRGSEIVTEAAATAALVAAAAAAPASPLGRALRSATGKGNGRPPVPDAPTTYAEAQE